MEMAKKENIEEALRWLEIDRAKEKSVKISEYISLVEKHRKWGGLMGRREVGAGMGKQVIDSLCFVEAIDREPGKRIADLGSGGGFPGMILAITEHNNTFDLIEANRRKSSFLALAIGRLGIKNAHVIPSRAEELTGSSYDVVLSRAAGRLSELLPIAMNLVRRDGKYMTLKGLSEVEEEIEKASDVARDCGAESINVVRPELPGARDRVAILVVRKREGLRGEGEGGGTSGEGR